MRRPDKDVTSVFQQWAKDLAQRPIEDQIYEALLNAYWDGYDRAIQRNKGGRRPRQSAAGKPEDRP